MLGRSRGILLEEEDAQECLSAGHSFAASHDERKEGTYMAKYGKKAQSKVERAMHERKLGTLMSGRSGKKVTSRKQAIAIGLSEARREGDKVPAPTGRRTRKASSRSAS
jgi:hypothetical protein